MPFNARIRLDPVTGMSVFGDDKRAGQGITEPIHCANAHAVGSFTDGDELYARRAWPI